MYQTQEIETYSMIWNYTIIKLTFSPFPVAIGSAQCAKLRKMTSRNGC